MGDEFIEALRAYAAADDEYQRAMQARDQAEQNEMEAQSSLTKARVKVYELVNKQMLEFKEEGEVIVGG